MAKINKVQTVRTHEGAKGRAFAPEQQLRRALAISQGDPLVLIQSPLAISLYVIAAAAVLVPLWFRLRGKGEVFSQLAADED